MEYAYTVYNPTDDQRHLAKPHHIKAMDWTGYVVACSANLRFTLNAMLTPLFRASIVDGHIVRTIPTCAACLEIYKVSVRSLEAVES